ncbi:DUF5302 domain-containing protein [Isoptericola aurantiacus]|uniref:DUF5302 domain-containing protein n=1 Tax=Isoptericola aurantiacus TaxID=3377839 RepID=UPI00383B79B9
MTADKKSQGPDDATKERFKEALAKKHAASHPSADGGRNTGPVHGSETAGQVQPIFRRKSG